MLSRFCSDLQNLNEKSAEITEKLLDIGVKLPFSNRPESYIEQKYFYKELLEKPRITRIQHAPRIVFDVLFMKKKEEKLRENKHRLKIKERFLQTEASHVYW